MDEKLETSLIPDDIDSLFEDCVKQQRLQEMETVYLIPCPIAER